MKDMTGRIPRPSLNTDNYHDLERRSFAFLHSEVARLEVNKLWIQEVSSDTTLTGVYDIILVDAAFGRVTITLPASATYPFKQYRIKKVDSTSHLVEVEPASTEDIDGQDEWLILFQYDCMDIVSDGDESWYMI